MPAWEKIGLGLRPEIGKMAAKWILGSLRTQGKYGQEIGKMERNSQQMAFRAIFLISWPYFPNSCGEAKIYFSGIFFPISGRRPKPIFSQAGMFATAVPATVLIVGLHADL